MTPLEKYNKLMGEDDEPDALERLAFFCSLAMNGRDWLDVERFFVDVRREIEAMK
jgi:hypothetical protein